MPVVCCAGLLLVCPSFSVAASSSDQPGTFDVYFQQGQTLYQRHELEQAANAFETALKLQPASEEAAQWLVKVREEQAYAQLSQTLPPLQADTAVPPQQDASPQPSDRAA